MSKEIGTASLEGFEFGTFASSSHQSRDVYRVGSGPAVIVIHEVPAITPLVAALARKVAQHGMTAVVPNILGTPGRTPSTSYFVRSAASACASREFTVLATNKTSPIVTYLRELATHEHETCGGPDVGAPDIFCVSP